MARNVLERGQKVKVGRLLNGMAIGWGNNV
jgi:hypothetical protein